MEFLSKGTYGKVYRFDNKVVKKSTLIKDKKIDCANLVECAFVSSFRDIPFFTEASHIELDNKKLCIYQKYKGITLHEYAQNKSYKNRLELFPYLMCQMARILIWLKKHRICHVDIKPSNFCIDSNNHLSLIDFGFVSLVHNFSGKYHGTENFADPKFLDNSERIRYSYDMFSCGMTLYSFLSKDNAPIFSLIQPSQFQKDLVNNVDNGETIFELFSGMLAGEINRISPETLYHKLSKYWELYPLIEDRMEKPVYYNISNQVNLSTKMYGLLIDWLIDVCVTQKMTEIVSHMVKLLYRFMSSYEIIIKRKNFQLIGSGILYLSALVNNYDRFTPEMLVYYSGNGFTEKELLNICVDICETLNWELFPIGGMAEAMLSERLSKHEIKMLYLEEDNNSEKDGDSKTDECVIEEGGENSLPVRLIPSKYCFMSEDEKYGVLSSLGYSLRKNSTLC